MHIKSNIHDYTVTFEDSFEFVSKLKAMPSRVFVLDRQVSELYPNLTKDVDPKDIIFIDAIEQNKTLDAVQYLLKELVKRDEKRNLTLISIGGGIIQDITGYAASCLYRGIKWIFVPTTLLAQADSCVGSKTSINFEGYKNILGGFYPPHQIHLCAAFLDSLSKTDYYSGVGEIIKFLLLVDTAKPDFDEIYAIAQDLYQNRNRQKAINRSLAVKQSYINQDEFDSGKRNLFNYGHCFGHALEVSSDFAVPHGIAVTIGMVFANIVSLGRGDLSDKIYRLLNKRLLLPNIPIQLHRKWFDSDILLNALKNDKKRVGKDLTIILPSSDQIDAIKINDLTELEFSRSLTFLIAEIGVQ
jgi:3-dehydroquinate synthase